MIGRRRNLPYFHRGISICILSCTFFIFINAVHSLAASDYKYPGNDKVMIYAPGYEYPCDEPDQDTIYDTATETIFPDAKFFRVDSGDIKSLPKDLASVEAVKSFGDYGTVIIKKKGTRS